MTVVKTRSYIDTSEEREGKADLYYGYSYKSLLRLGQCRIFHFSVHDLQCIKSFKRNMRFNRQRMHDFYFPFFFFYIYNRSFRPFFYALIESN